MDEVKKVVLFGWVVKNLIWMFTVSRRFKLFRESNSLQVEEFVYIAKKLILKIIDYWISPTDELYKETLSLSLEVLCFKGLDTNSKVTDYLKDALSVEKEKQIPMSDVDIYLKKMILP